MAPNFDKAEDVLLMLPNQLGALFMSLGLRFGMGLLSHSESLG